MKDIMDNQTYGRAAVLHRIQNIAAPNKKPSQDDIAEKINAYVQECMDIQLFQEDKRNLFTLVLYARKALPYDWFPEEREKRHALEKAVAAYLYILMKQKGFLVRFSRADTESTLGIALHCLPFTQNELADAYAIMGSL